jgi:single-stranded DNA-specific DHH superfamily exonuclease
MPMRNRQEMIRQKGFSMTPRVDSIEDYAKMRVGLKTLDDANLDLNYFKKLDNRRGDKTAVLQALANHDYNSLKSISNLFYETSGIYERLCKYLAYLYRFDWYVIPFVGLTDVEKLKEDKIIKEFYGLLDYLDNSYIKK